MTGSRNLLLSSWDGWSEVVESDSPLERERAEADLREWEAERLADRLGRDDPIIEEGTDG